jgi:hypothetical protein
MPKKNKPNLTKFKISANGFPLPLKAKCFQCHQPFLIKFVIPRQAYSQKNNWGYWTDQKGSQKICDTCLRKLYYNKPVYWATVKNTQKRALFRVYLSGGKIA